MKTRSLDRRRFLGMFAGGLAAGTAGLPAAERYGIWTPLMRAEIAEEFMVRMQDEFKGRARRLTEMMEQAPEISLPFIASRDSVEPKVMKDWKEFREGQMSDGSTTKWIDKALKELEANRRKLEAAEKPAAAAWTKKYKDNPPEPVIPAELQAFIYEMDVQANQLGVIMDNSSSMTEFLPAVRAEISTRFPAARFMEVNGSYLKTQNPAWGPQGEWYYTVPPEHRNLFEPKWWLKEIPRKDIHYHMIGWQRDTLAAIRAMVVNMDVDAIYWFCDFDDTVEPSAIRALEELLSKNKARLYVHTVKSKPPGSLANVIQKSGGSLTRAIPKAAKPGTPPPAPVK